MSTALLNFAYNLLDKGLIPGFLVRIAIRALLRQRLREIDHGSLEKNLEAKMNWIGTVRKRDVIADETEKANEQHYEVSTAFMVSALGPRMKYSSCLYPTRKETLEEAEVLMLESYCEKARLVDGLDILDLGCGWGSLSLFMAEKYPNSRVIGLSNSSTQKAHIDSIAVKKGITNLEIVTADVNTHDFPEHIRFDRVLSIEMFEHMKNYEALLYKVSSWLKTDDSLVFTQMFCHKSQPYDFVDDDGWMARNFFSGGTMPSHDTLAYFQSDLTLEKSWWINGRHYSQTSEDWLKNQDKHARVGLPELERDAEAKGLGKEEGRKTFYRFRVFFMACAELFAMNGGDEWGVVHTLFKKKRSV